MSFRISLLAIVSFTCLAACEKRDVKLRSGPMLLTVKNGGSSKVDPIFLGEHVLDQIDSELKRAGLKKFETSNSALIVDGKLYISFGSWGRGQVAIFRTGGYDTWILEKVEPVKIEELPTVPVR